MFFFDTSRVADVFGRFFWIIFSSAQKKLKICLSKFGFLTTKPNKDEIGANFFPRFFIFEIFDFRANFFFSPTLYAKTRKKWPKNDENLPKLAKNGSARPKMRQIWSKQDIGRWETIYGWSYVGLPSHA